MVPRQALSLLVVLFGLALGAPVAGQQAGRPSPPFLVIVGPNKQIGSLDRGFLEDAFLKKITTWPDGETMRPVDLTADAPARKAFTSAVLNRSVEAVKGYWQQRIFSGRDVPPPELGSDAEVINYVLAHEGAVGYVSGSANPGTCHVVEVR